MDLSQSAYPRLCFILLLTVNKLTVFFFFRLCAIPSTHYSLDNAWIHAKVKWVLPWPMLHPSTRFQENWLSSCCKILLTDKKAPLLGGCNSYFVSWCIRGEVFWSQKGHLIGRWTQWDLIRPSFVVFIKSFRMLSFKVQTQQGGRPSRYCSGQTYSRTQLWADEADCILINKCSVPASHMCAHIQHTFIWTVFV